MIFWAIGYDGPRAVKEIFFTPIVASYKWPRRRAQGGAADPDRARALRSAIAPRSGTSARRASIIVGALGGGGVALC